MIIQLEQSIDHDCSNSYSERELANLTVQTVQDYRAMKEMRLREDLERYTDMTAEEQANIESKNKWLKDLRDSLV